MITATKIRDFLIDNEIVSEDALDLLQDVNGFNQSTFNDVLYCRLGYYNIPQLYESESDVYDFSMFDDEDLSE